MLRFLALCAVAWAVLVAFKVALVVVLVALAVVMLPMVFIGGLAASLFSESEERKRRREAALYPFRIRR